MSDLFGNHIVGFPTKRLIYKLSTFYLELLYREKYQRECHRILTGLHVIAGITNSKSENVRSSLPLLTGFSAHNVTIRRETAMISCFVCKLLNKCSPVKEFLLSLFCHVNCTVKLSYEIR